MTYRPPQCSEREPDGTWEDCTWCSGDMLGNAAHGSQVYPVTQTEYEALRAASGDSMTGGSNIGDLRAGMLKRWGWSGSVLARPTVATLVSTLLPGVGAVVQGSMGAFPLGHLLRRWDVNFGGPHAVYVQRESTLSRVWWMNPQAPRSHAGEWVSWADFVKYYTALPGASVMTVVIGSRAPQIPDTSEEDVAEIETFRYPTPIPVTGANVTLFLPDGTNKKVASLASLAIGTSTIDQSTNKAPQGSGWLKLGKRPWAGWYVPEATVTLAHSPGDPVADARAAGRESMRSDVDRAVGAIP